MHKKDEIMKYYPVCLDVRNRDCLVVGGGGVGTRKVRTLVSCGAVVTVVSPEVSSHLLQMADDNVIGLLKRPYRRDDLQGKFLVIGATNDEILNQQIYADAGSLNMLCNIADRPASCNFILPSIVKRGDLTISISTSGTSPAFAKHLRKRLENEFGNEYSVFLDLMGRVRKKLLAEQHAPEAHKPLFEKLVKSPLVEMIDNNDIEGIDRILFDTLGHGFRFQSLMADK